MDEVEKRLREASDNCFTCYETWQKDHKDGKARESLQEAIHEMRKVSSRLEIEIAISERNEMTQKPIPIPPHRSSSKNSGASQSILEFDDDAQHGNSPGGHGRSGSGRGGHGRGGQKSSGGGQNNRRRRGPTKKAGGGE